MHGAYAQVVRGRLDAKSLEVFEALRLDAPAHDEADAVTVQLLAQALCRLDDVGAYLRDHGLVDTDGNPRPVLDLERRLRLEAADHADALGMSSRSRHRIGLDAARAFDLAQTWADEDAIDGGASDG